METQHKTQTEWVTELLARVPVGRKSARFKAAMPFISNQINLGVAHSDIVSVLVQCGLDINRNTFEVYLYRLRQRGGLEQYSSSSLTGPVPHDPPPTETTKNERPDPPDRDASEIPAGVKPVMPADIDRIIKTPVDLRAFSKAGREVREQLENQEK